MQDRRTHPQPGNGERTVYGVAYWLLYAAVIGCLLMLAIQFGEVATGGWMDIVPILLGAVLLWLRSGVLLLVAIQIFLLLQEPMGLSEYDFAAHTLLPVLVLVGIISASRFDGLYRYEGSNWLEFVKRVPRCIRRLVSGPIEVRAMLVRTLGIQWLFVLTTALACTIIAAIIIAIVGRNEDADVQVGLLPRELQAVELATVLTTVFLVTSIVTGYWKWLKLSREQARISLRSMYANWLDDDYWLLYRKRKQWARKLKSRADRRPPRPAQRSWPPELPGRGQ